MLQKLSYEPYWDSINDIQHTLPKLQYCSSYKDTQYFLKNISIEDWARCPRTIPSYNYHSLNKDKQLQVKFIGAKAYKRVLTTSKNYYL